MKKASFILAGILGASALIGIGQNTDDLKLKLKRNQTQINLTEKTLEETLAEKKATFRTVKTYEKQIRLREEVIASFHNQLGHLEIDIKDAEDEISGITSELERIKAEFTEAIVASYKNSRRVSKLHFVFQSESFNDLLKRITYLEKIIEFRRVQLELIEKKKKENSFKINVLNEKKNEIERLLVSEETESNELSKDKEVYDQLVKDLLKREQDLKREIEERKRRSRLLEQQIKNQISGDEEGAGDQEFQFNSLPWPVRNGYISEPFGTHKHEDLKNIQTQNNGINIVCNKSSQVYPVSPGVVSAVLQVPGMQNSILVKHEGYYSVYANLEDVSVNRGDSLNLESIIGRAGVNEEGITEIHLEIWKGSLKLDPERYLNVR
jgi:murein DD-endopeptidase MepM/ murein hydrolase activator NlpD